MIFTKMSEKGTVKNPGVEAEGKGGENTSRVEERRTWWPKPGEREGMSICTELSKPGQPVSRQKTPFNTLTEVRETSSSNGKSSVGCK